MISFFSKFDILSKDQFGFRAKFCTEYAIADIYDKLTNNLDKRLSSCAIFLDLMLRTTELSHTWHSQNAVAACGLYIFTTHSFALFA